MPGARYDIIFLSAIILYLAPFSFCNSQNQELHQQFDIHSYHIDLDVNDTNSFIKGNCNIYINNTEEYLPYIFLELSNNLTIDSVLLNNKTADFTHFLNTIKIENIENRENPDILLSIFYGGNGKGISKYGVNNSYIEEYNQKITWTFSEPFYSKYWFPVKQDLNDKADSVKISITVDSKLTAVSNGILENKEVLNENKVKYHWVSKYPIAYYLISFAVSEFTEYSFKIPVEGDTVLCKNYIYNDPEYLIKEKENIDKTQVLIPLYSRIFGNYPFINEKYGHVVAPIGGGMEHQTLTTISGFEFELVAHELAHQWWGNLVTCSSWNDIWINEGFASYAEYLAYEFLDEPEKANEWLTKTFTSALSENSGSIYISDSAKTDSRIFNHRLSYDKGAVIIHLLRERINNDEVFFTILREFLQRYAYKSAGAIEFKMLAEEISGTALDEFFNSYYYGDGYPVVIINWQQNDKNLILNINQDRNFETAFHFKIDYFNRENVLMDVIAKGMTFTDTLPVQSLVKNITLNPLENHLINLYSIYRIPGTTYPDDYKLAYNSSEKEWIIYLFNESEYTIRLFDIQGKMLLDEIKFREKYSIKAQDMKTGLYIIEIRKKIKSFGKK